MIRFIPFSICLVLLLNLNAQRPGGGEGMPSLKITGRVIEGESENGLQYVSVAAFRVKDSSLVTGTISNADGNFEINNLKPGRYFVRAEFIGFKKFTTESFTLTPQKPVLKIPEIALKESLVQISEVEVVSDGPSLAYKLDKKVLTVSRELAAAGGTAVEVLQNVPSVESDVEGNVTVRGSSNFTVLIDGRQSPLSGSDALNQISASAIDKVEIITNPSAKYDPDGTSGIINIITKKGKYNGVSFVANASIGNGKNTFDNEKYDDFVYSGDVALTVKQKKFTYTLTAGTRNQGFDMERIIDRRTYRNSNRDSADVLSGISNGVFIRNSTNAAAQVSYLLSENNTIYVGASLFDFKLKRGNLSRNKVDSASLSSSDYYTANTGFKVNPFLYQVVIGNKHEFGTSNHFLETELTYRFGDKKNEEFSNQFYSDENWRPNELQNQRNSSTYEEITEYRAEIDYTVPISDFLKFESGALLRSEQKTSTYDLTDVESIAYSFDYYRNIYGGYIILSGQLPDKKIGYSAGLRSEYTDRYLYEDVSDTVYGYTKTDWYPSAALSYELKNNNKLQITYSRRVERPRDYALLPITLMTDGFNSFRGNPDLMPEYTDAVELNYQFVWGKSYLAIETFFRNTKNAFERRRQYDENGQFFGTWANAGTAKYYGAELSGNFRVAKWWTLSPSATFYYNTILGEYGNDEVYRYGYSGRGMINNLFNITSKTQIQWSNSYSAPGVSINGERKATYYSSAAVKQDLLDRRLSLTFSINDIFDTRNRQMITDEANFYIDTKMSREAPTYMLSVSYRFNQTQRNRGDRSGRNGGEGMDMVF